MCKQMTRLARAGVWPAPRMPTFIVSVSDCACAPLPNRSSSDSAPRPLAEFSKKSRRERSIEQQSGFFMASPQRTV